MSDKLEKRDDQAESDLSEFLHGRKHAKFVRFFIAVLGSLPWVGGLLAASAAMSAEQEQGRVNEFTRQWLLEHQRKIQELSETVARMMRRLEELGDAAEKRLQDEGYLNLVRYGFRVWDEAGTRETRERVQKTLTHAAATAICSDDVVRLFLLWLKTYDDLHMRVVRVIYKYPFATRAFIWEQVHGVDVRENSAEADLFRLMIRDLSTGGVIRQHREITHDGRFLARPRVTVSWGASFQQRPTRKRIWRSSSC